MANASILDDIGATSAHTAEALLDLEDLTQRYIAIAARALLTHPEVNVALIGKTPISSDSHLMPPQLDESPFESASNHEATASNRDPDKGLLDHVLDKLAPDGLWFFALNESKQDRFSISRKKAPEFFDGILRAGALERARVALLANVPSATTIDRTNEPFADDDVLSEAVAGWSLRPPLVAGALHESTVDHPPLFALHEATRQLNAVVEHILQQCPNEEARRSIRKSAQRLLDVIEEALEPTQHDPNALTAHFHPAVDAAFEKHAPNVPARGRATYTGIILAVLGLARGSLSARASYERVHKASATSASFDRPARSPGRPCPHCAAIARDGDPWTL